eukprot:snap_masked-scaffold_1-processed-gene-16.40-mRNA-1 protein AED:1.00 eAED:1.00 QI:0/0/0/0/1/1/4/0/66
MRLLVFLFLHENKVPSTFDQVSLKVLTQQDIPVPGAFIDSIDSFGTDPYEIASVSRCCVSAFGSFT